ncbi:Gfo/Idh/MocA family oxidoreductase [Algivirga pacifica]|uniref:Gfo/Idh/MocA family oxidoreductase n=1 Tax=Algivirga pacifica TaxID=1162670 RepID=A0ABP9DBY3_9BACT
MNHLQTTRRNFLRQGGTLAAGIMLPSFLNLSCADQKSKKLGVALVGLGRYSTNELAVALQATQSCYLAGVVSGTPEKRDFWADQYNLKPENIYDYDNFDRIADNKDIDIVYVVLPNSMHAEFVIRAAQAGKHVICEKPLGISSAECLQMINACKKHGVKLSVGYRLHFDPYHQYLMQLSDKVQYLEASNGYTLKDHSEWRMDKSLAGGGALMNIGIYCLQSACYVTGKTPISVTAQATKTRPDLFKDIEETLSFQLQFDRGVSTNFVTSHQLPMNRLMAISEGREYTLSPAFSYRGIGKKYAFEQYKELSQQAAQMDDFATVIRKNKVSSVSGEMGLRDLRIIEAIYEAADARKPISISDKLYT